VFHAIHLPRASSSEVTQNKNPGGLDAQFTSETQWHARWIAPTSALFGASFH
jgi:hypothetical protein